MIRISLIFILLLFSVIIKAQTDSAYISTTVETDIYTTSYAVSHDKILQFLTSNHIKVQSQNEQKSSLNIKFQVNESVFNAYNTLIGELGYVSSNEVNATNNFQKVSELELELNYLKQQKESYRLVLEKLEVQSDRYLSIWEELKKTEEKIFTKERELLSHRNKENTYSVSLMLRDEITRPENNRVSFVNMPGGEFSILRIESPQAGISSDTYYGYFLKYLFTKGKSYATIGAYKSTSKNPQDTTMFNELFSFGFGQDFYSRHFGRGDNRYFNLYSGYTIGDILATSKTVKSNIFYLSPAIGLEILKTRFILLDTKVCYFVPLSYNKNLRGWSFNMAFNFVF
jgi:hypothetical protein